MNSSKVDKIFMTILTIALVVFSICCIFHIHELNNKISQEQHFKRDFDVRDDSDSTIYAELTIYENAYCQEIDSLLSANNIDLADIYDSDSIDMNNSVNLEKIAIEKLGDKFYIWRAKESKTAWDWDVMIARYCY